MPASPQARFRPDRTHLIVAVLMLLIMLIPAGNSPAILGWVLLIPLAYLWWIFQAATVVDHRGISACPAFGSRRFVSWEEFAGIGFERASAYATTTKGGRVKLPAITFNSLPKLSEASQGRIPDVLSAGQAAVADKVRVVRRDGAETLITKEEYEVRQRETPASASEPEASEGI